MGSKIDIEKRHVIIHLHKQGFSGSQITKHFSGSISKSTINKIIKRFIVTGTLSDKVQTRTGKVSTKKEISQIYENNENR